MLSMVPLYSLAIFPTPRISAIPSVPACVISSHRAFGLPAAQNTAAACPSLSPELITRRLPSTVQQMVNRVNFADGRIRPTLSIDISAGLELYKKETRSLRLQADIENLNNRLNVLDFAGLFSGSAVAPPRSYFLRLAGTF